MAEAIHYYNNQSFINSYFTLNIQLQEYFTNLLFPEDPSRIFVSSTAHAFRRRVVLQTQDPNATPYLNNLNFPFLNYKGKIKMGTKRPWYNYSLNTSGIFIPELQTKVKMIPVTINYDSTVYYHREDDKQYALNQLLFQSSQEIQVPYYIQVNGIDVKNQGILSFNPDDDPVYNENDWLKQNNIHTIKLDFEIQTSILQINDPGTSWGLTESVILNFAKMNPNITGDQITEPLTTDQIYDLITETYTSE
jgi:hypothetical protein